MTADGSAAVTLSLQAPAVPLALVARYAGLTSREKEVMALVVTGLMNKQVAGKLNLSEITVKVHRGTMMRKMGLRTLADLVKASERLRAGGQ